MNIGILPLVCVALRGRMPCVPVELVVRIPKPRPGAHAAPPQLPAPTRQSRRREAREAAKKTAKEPTP
jgi:hypothetical protein